MTGCFGRLCRSCSPVMKRMRLERYPADANGERIYSSPPDVGWVCGFLCGVSGRSGDRVDLPGRLGGGEGREKLVAAAGSHLPLEPGDIITDPEGRRLRVTDVYKNGGARVTKC